MLLRTHLLTRQDNFILTKIGLWLSNVSLWFAYLWIFFSMSYNAPKFWIQNFELCIQFVQKIQSMQIHSLLFAHHQIPLNQIIHCLFFCFLFKKINYAFLNAKPEFHFDNANAFYMLCRRSFCHFVTLHFCILYQGTSPIQIRSPRFYCYVQCMKYMSFTQLAN